MREKSVEPLTCQPTGRRISKSPGSDRGTQNHIVVESMLTSEITNTKVNNYTNENENRSSNLDASPAASQGPNTSQFMKSFMKSYNAGNVQFYDNLHKKYFDKARGQED